MATIRVVMVFVKPTPDLWYFLMLEDFLMLLDAEIGDELDLNQ